MLGKWVLWGRYAMCNPLIRSLAIYSNKGSSMTARIERSKNVSYFPGSNVRVALPGVLATALAVCLLGLQPTTAAAEDADRAQAGNLGGDASAGDQPFAQLELEPIASGFTSPHYLVCPPEDQRRFVLDLIGTITILDDDGTPQA